jgi:rhamnosyltransferase
MNDLSSPKIYAVVVCYFPKEEVLGKTLESLASQVNKIILSDNTPGGSEIAKKFQQKISNLEVIHLLKNTGIAVAQNVGIKKAIEEGAEFVLLSDEDTVYPENYVKEMLKAYFSLPDREKVACIAPNYADINREGEKQGFVIFKDLFSRRIFPEKGLHEITQAIASGMIIPTRVFLSVGLMYEDLFLDWVDLEWCWKARAKGYKIIGNADVVIYHRLGDVGKKLGKKFYPVHSEIRHYYIIRNCVHLALRSPYVNFLMRLNLLYKSIKNTIGYSILGTPHFRHFLFCLKGIFHGLIGRLGPLEKK